jgi:dinuclear metal center YbgI/SA1388 family protein
VRIAEFQKQFEQSAPPAIAWKGDNIGHQIGRADAVIQNILIALDCTPEVAAEAIRKNANLIVTHHPLLFHPLKKITPQSRVGDLVLTLTEHRVNLYAAHTNLDSVQWGVNFCLANTLGLTDVRILSPLIDSVSKIVVFVPQTHTEAVANAMHNAGAGMFAKYDKCSFRSSGTGTFRGKGNAQPFIGTVGILERAAEERIEMMAENWKVDAIIAAMLNVHPYEEVAYDVYPLRNRNTEYGLGAIGNLSKQMSQSSFLSLVKKKLGASALRFSGTAKAIRRVAVCGGSGSDYINDAVSQGADAMVTADLKYHTFQEFEERILLVDAGHYETEHVVLPTLAKKCREIAIHGKLTGKIFITQHRTNPVHIF